MIYAGLRYHWLPDSFLSRPQAEYAMQRLWRLIDSGQSSSSTCPPILRFKAATSADVQRMLDARPSELSWMSVEDALPTGARNPFDTSHLPIPCPCASLPEDDRPEAGAFPFDLVTWTFLFLSRWEEVHRPQQLDQHGRVLSSGLFATRHGFHRRPVVDEWALIGRMWIEHLQPGCLSPARPATLQLTHDVDHPRRFPNWSSVARRSVGTLIRTRGRVDKVIGEFFRGVRAVCDFRHDSYWQRLRHLMQFEESVGLRGQYNFMASEPGAFDEGYDINSRALQFMLAEIADRGHRIGWHPGYAAATDVDVLKRERDQLQQAAPGEVSSGRYHYLRWNPRDSWDQWDALGLRTDGSVGFTDDVGFRCGTSHAFPVYSLAQERPLDLVESPLHVMDWGLYRTRPDDDARPDDGASGEGHARTGQWSRPRTNEGQGRAALLAQLLDRVAVVGGDASVLIHHDFHDWQFVSSMLEQLREWIV